MKKVLFLMIVAVSTILNGYADLPDIKGPLTPITLSIRFVGNSYKPISRPRTPMRMPEVYLSESTIIFENEVFCDRIVLVNTDNNIVYDVDTAGISGDSIALPSYLTGEYGIYFICENYYFYGEIVL